MIGKRHIAHNAWAYSVHESEITSGVRKLEKIGFIKIIPTVGKKVAARLQKKVIKLTPAKKPLYVNEVIDDVKEPPIPQAELDKAPDFPWVTYEEPAKIPGTDFTMAAPKAIIKEEVPEKIIETTEPPTTKVRKIEGTNLTVAKSKKVIEPVIVEPVVVAPVAVKPIIEPAKEKATKKPKVIKEEEAPKKKTRRKRRKKKSD